MRIKQSLIIIIRVSLIRGVVYKWIILSDYYELFSVINNHVITSHDC